MTIKDTGTGSAAYPVMEQKGNYAYTPGNIALQGGQGNKGSLDWMSGFYPFDC